MLPFLIVLALLLPMIGLALLSLMAKKPENLGIVNGQLAPCPNTPNCVSSQADDPLHRLPPLPFTGAPQEVLQRLKAVLATLPRLKIVTEKDNYLHAEATSRLFRFVDDVEFYVDDAAKVIHFRSASRVGRSDLGVNRARLEAIRQAFEQQFPPPSFNALKE